MYKSSLYRKSSAERHFHVQVSRYLPTINQIAIDLIWKTRREAHLYEQVSFVHRFIDSAGQIHLEETGLALIPGVDEYEIVK